MENNALNEMNRVHSNLHDEMLAEQFLDQMMNDFKRSKVLEEIDQSLKNKDKEAFLRLTEKLKSIPCSKRYFYNRRNSKKTFTVF
ncbi:IDEAL domain-containing protein [Priestia megaterium]|uniref:IDEAL domain-containing protein n=1 Tax=Priestia megaterium TaxID=1404 RepID=UPI0026E23650|nr:IDEAL domain-containing protein [Priestia megaterium]MDO6849730.1 IDEAL domain-containing protein [Priestia megaterium]